MDIYQQVIVKLYEVTGGKESLAVDLKDLVKKLGFYGHYSSIFERLSQEGWVAEDRKADFVRITHWGIAAAKKAQPSEGGTEKATSANAAACENLAKEFAALIGNFAKDASEENFKKAQNKFIDLETSFNLARNDIR
jgi:phage anti-repressor protein